MLLACPAAPAWGVGRNRNGLARTRLVPGLGRGCTTRTMSVCPRTPVWTLRWIQRKHPDGDPLASLRLFNFDRNGVYVRRNMDRRRESRARRELYPAVGTDRVVRATIRPLGEGDARFPRGTGTASAVGIEGAQGVADGASPSLAGCGPTRQRRFACCMISGCRLRTFRRSRTCGR